MSIFINRNFLVQQLPESSDQLQSGTIALYAWALLFPGSPFTVSPRVPFIYLPPGSPALLSLCSYISWSILYLVWSTFFYTVLRISALEERFLDCTSLKISLFHSHNLLITWLGIQFSIGNHFLWNYKDLIPLALSCSLVLLRNLSDSISFACDLFSFLSRSLKELPFLS